MGKLKKLSVVSSDEDEYTCPRSYDFLIVIRDFLVEQLAVFQAKKEKASEYPEVMACNTEINSIKLTLEEINKKISTFGDTSGASSLFINGSREDV